MLLSIWSRSVLFCREKDVKWISRYCVKACWHKCERRCEEHLKFSTEQAFAFHLGFFGVTLTWTFLHLSVLISALYLPDVWSPPALTLNPGLLAHRIHGNIFCVCQKWLKCLQGLKLFEAALSIFFFELMKCEPLLWLFCILNLCKISIRKPPIMNNN